MPISSVSRHVTPEGACIMRKPPGIPNELFKYEREKRHWTQGDVADKIGAPDERLIRRWERGEVAPTPHYRSKLAEVFGKSAKELGFPPAGELSFWYMPYRYSLIKRDEQDKTFSMHRLVQAVLID